MSCRVVHGLTTRGRAGTREWTQLECTGEVPSQRSGHNAVMYNGAMYVFGGYDGSKRLNDLFKLDISTSHSLPRPVVVMVVRWLLTSAGSGRSKRVR